MFPNSVKANLALAVAGDFATTNPRASVVALSGELVAGDSGLIVGRFGWRDGTTPAKVNNAGSGKPAGFVGRGNGFEGTITAYLGESTMTILKGKEVTLYKEGDFFALNTGSGAATVGMKAFASLTTGQVQFAAAGATVSGYIETDWFAATAADAAELVVITRFL